VEFIVILAALAVAFLLAALFFHVKPLSNSVPFGVAVENLRTEILKELKPVLKRMLDAIRAIANLTRMI
jgi:hypothetical protein